MKMYTDSLDSLCPSEVDLDNPSVTFMVCENFVVGAKEPNAVYFGVLLSAGNHESSKKFDLKKRGYLGTTSMDAELSLVMGNMALV
jgi:tRNA (guanine10-N2)-methyltransferase